ncbi:hypothetical protein GCM10027160_24080 [Streptomyces calidiresistens]|uniref:Uncharacterized protein n=1 Tax=Streptomyces calidiresistens TaxID=1485586 RepID=A0A7W3T480_9ACTN|nr:hypothetical protein [Streptomyces calidiresistens]MBB0230627.1 hypothetical protein [Streptomyces calidiresistens]
MSDTTNTAPYTDEDIELAAVLLHRERCGVAPFEVRGALDEEAVKKQPGERGLAPAPGSPLWGELPQAQFETAVTAVHGLVDGAADLSGWAVPMGRDGLEPDEATAEIKADDEVLVRMHFAFGPSVPVEARDGLVMQVTRQLMTG